MAIQASFEKNGLVVTVILVVIIQLVLAFQGFDVCDDGFALTFYQQFFNDADSVEYNFVYWLSGLVGGVWYELFGSGGVLSFRFLAIIVNTTTLILSYQVLKPYIKKFFLLPALVMTLFINDFGYLAFYNNHITALLAVLSIYFLHRGLVYNNLKYLFLAGLIIGLNVFSRLPNLSLFALVCAIPFWYGFRDGGFKAMIKPLSVFKFGFFLAFVIVFLVLKLLGQFEIMQRAINSLFDIGGTDQSSHNVSELLKIYLNNYIKIAFYFVSLLIGLALLFKVDINRIKSKVLYYLIISLGFIVALQWFRVSYIFGFYALGYLGVFSIGFLTGDKKIRLLAFIALILQFLLPFGSGGGITSIGYASLWLSLPLFFYLFQLRFEGSQLFDKFRSWIPITSNSGIRLVFVLVLLAFGVVKLYRWSNQAYFDPGSRFIKTYEIKSEMAKGIFTTKERATVLNEVLEVLPAYTKPDDYLFVYDKTPMLHFLTKTKPYMYNSWPWIYDSVTFKKKLNMAENNRKELPVVVVQKFETIGHFSEPMEDYLSVDTKENYFHNNSIAKTMQDFLNINHYELVWTNSYFEIFIPKDVN